MKTKPEVLVLWRGFFPSRQKGFISGPTSPIAYEIFCRLLRTGFGVTMICWHFPEQPHTERVEGIDIIRIKKSLCKVIWEKVLGLKISIRAMYEITRRKIDLLHIMGEPVWHGWSLFVARLLGIPVLVSFLDPWYPLYIYEVELGNRERSKVSLLYLLLNRKIILFLEWLYAKGANVVTVVTDELKKYYLFKGITAGKIFVISNAASLPDMEDEKIVSLKSIYGLNSKGIVIGYLGGIQKVHGVEILLKSFIALAEKYKNIKLLYIGDGSDMGLLRTQIPDKLRDRVIFTGRVPYDEVPSHLFLIDCGFISWENNLAMSCASPLKVFEYMAAKKPVIGGCTDHIKQIIEKSNGGIFMKERTVECAIEALNGFVNLPPEDKIRFGENACQYICKTHTWDRVANQYVRIYNRLIYDEKRNFEVIL